MNKSISSKQKIEELINNNVVILDPNNTYIDDSCSIGSGTTIYPGVIINNNVEIKENCIIQAHSYIANNVIIHDNVVIGQFSLIRDDTQIGYNSKIGPHCEIARSILGCNCTIGHKNFIGDAILMDEVKFGAGAIIANTNWNERFKTFIGAKSKIGVNCTIIAPINIGANCFIAAGVTLKQNVEDNKFVKNCNNIDIRENRDK